MARLPGHDLDAGDPVLLGLVRQHRPGDHVADREHALHVGLEVGVDDDGAALVQLDAEFVHAQPGGQRPSESEEHTSELQSLMRISYAAFCLKKKNRTKKQTHPKSTTTK